MQFLDVNFEPINEIDLDVNTKSLIWEQNFLKENSFELYYSRFYETARYIYNNKLKETGIINNITNDETSVVYKGVGLEKLLSDNVITFQIQYVEKSIVHIVSDLLAKFSQYPVIVDTFNRSNDLVDFQAIEGDLFDAITDFLSINILGFKIYWNYDDKTLHLTIIDILDSTEDREVLSISNENIISEKLEIDETEFKNFAWIKGENGVITSVDLRLSDSEFKKEIYVDGENISREIEGIVIDDNSYLNLLKENAKIELLEYQKSIDVVVQPSPNEDMQLGEVRWYSNSTFNISMAKRVDTIKYAWENGSFDREIEFN